MEIEARSTSGFLEKSIQELLQTKGKTDVLYFCTSFFTYLLYRKKKEKREKDRVYLWGCY